MTVKIGANWDDVHILVRWLKEGLNWRQAMMKLDIPLDPDFYDRPGSAPDPWMTFRIQTEARAGLHPDLPVPPGQSIPPPIRKRDDGVIVSTPDGKVWRVYADNTRVEVKVADRVKAELPSLPVRTEPIPVPPPPPQRIIQPGEEEDVRVFRRKRKER